MTTTAIDTTGIKVGDPDPWPNSYRCCPVGDRYACTAPIGHTGPHVAADATQVRAVWGEGLNSRMIRTDTLAVSAKTAAELLSISKSLMYELLRSGKIESRYQGSKILVKVDSLRAYYDSLPFEPPDAA